MSKRNTCQHKHTRWMEVGSRWRNPLSGAEDDYREIEVCCDCGIEIENIPEPCITCVGTIIGQWADNTGRVHFEMECPECGSSWESLDAPRFHNTIKERRSNETQGAEGNTTRTDSSKS